MLTRLKLIFKDRALRNKILFIFGALIIFRVLANIPIPGVDEFALAQLFSGNQFLGLLNIFSGGGLASLSIIMLGVGPYITASIVMQLLTIMSPKLKALYHEEGEAGRRKFAQYSRLFSVPLAALQGFGFLLLLERNGVLSGLGAFDMVTNIVLITAGSVLLMWIGELINEFGVGNGVSFIIFAGIVASIPTTFRQLLFTFTPDQLTTYLGFAVAAILITLGVVIVTEAERPVPVTYAKQVRGNKVYGGASTYLPLRLNQSGVMPIIFALSILLFPQMIVNFLANVNNDIVARASEFVLGILNNGWVYSAFYFVLVFLFTYFYTAITFEPSTISKNLQKSGAFVPGVRPGKSTTDHLSNIITRLTLVGAVFLGIIAVLPLAMQALTGVVSFAIGGTALLIAVSVLIDLVKRIDAQVTMREY